MPSFSSLGCCGTLSSGCVRTTAGPSFSTGWSSRSWRCSSCLLLVMECVVCCAGSAARPGRWRANLTRRRCRTGRRARRGTNEHGARQRSGRSPRAVRERAARRTAQRSLPRTVLGCPNDPSIPADAIHIRFGLAPYSVPTAPIPTSCASSPQYAVMRGTKSDVDGWHQVRSKTAAQLPQPVRRCTSPGVRFGSPRPARVRRDHSVRGPALERLTCAHTMGFRPGRGGA